VIKNIEKKTKINYHNIERIIKKPEMHTIENILKIIENILKRRRKNTTNLKKVKKQDENGVTNTINRTRTLLLGEV
jgi:hypothetical protein